jgi:hypothetical protein
VEGAVGALLVVVADVGREGILGKFDFVLRGHEHLPSAIGVHPLGSDEQWVQIPAGALYNSDGAYPKSANVVTLNLDSGEGMAFFWRYFDENLKWRADVGLVQDGRAFFDLPPTLSKRLQEAHEQPSEVGVEHHDDDDDDDDAIGPPAAVVS